MILFPLLIARGGPLSVVADFEGASVRAVRIDQETRTVSFQPGGDRARGWPCWWYFRVEGTVPGETITLNLNNSTSVVANAEAALAKPLGGQWAMPARAMASPDGRAWRHTEKGAREGGAFRYSVTAATNAVWVAWGPPYTPSDAAAFVRAAAAACPGAEAGELCRSRGDRPVPLLHVREGDRAPARRFGVWVQARQHAWESGSSWVAQGFGEWVTGDAPEAAWLRQHADIFLVPVMDVDNAATGNGGKDAVPRDHNRDWSESPHWHEVIEARRRVRELIGEGRMDVFLDLHNPGPGDPTFFYVLDIDGLPKPMTDLRGRFMGLAHGRFARITPPVSLSRTPKISGPNYHPLWRNISANWVAMNGNPHTVSLCLETAWNSPASTTEGYRAVGASLAAAVREYLAERPERP